MVSAQEWLHSWKYRQSRSRVLACIVMFYMQVLIGVGMKVPIEFLLLVGVITYIAVWIAREGATKKEVAYHVLFVTPAIAFTVCLHIYKVKCWMAVGALLAGYVTSWAIHKIMSRGKEVL